MNRKQDPDPATFWREYEERSGEKVLAYSLGRYISGWDAYEEPLWGLVIATEGGFRFHHFPHEGWLQALSRLGAGGEAPKEKTIFISRDRILSVELRTETSWLKKLLLPRPPVLIVRYRKPAEGEHGPEAELTVETEYKTESLLRYLQPDDPAGG
ncbi:MAG: hypothetical protein LBD78_05880 [Spirochaetaceae bacterium]|nr:hypothetical protein [Spirochaetaceae bacterium]